MKKGFLISALVLLVILVIAIIAGGNDSSDKNVSNSEDSTISLNSDTEQVSQVIDTGWEYFSKTDEMTDKETKWASMKSVNSFEFDFPYNGGSYLTLSVRKSPKYGTDVYIHISKGQFLASEYNGTNKVSVRFDEDTPITFSTNEPSDGSSDLLFINNTKRFIERAKSAKSIKIQATFYQEGDRVFTFTTTHPLEWE